MYLIVLGDLRLLCVIVLIIYVCRSVVLYLLPNSLYLRMKAARWLCKYLGLDGSLLSVRQPQFQNHKTQTDTPCELRSRLPNPKDSPAIPFASQTSQRCIHTHITYHNTIPCLGMAATKQRIEQSTHAAPLTVSVRSSPLHLRSS